MYTTDEMFAKNGWVDFSSVFDSIEFFSNVDFNFTPEEHRLLFEALPVSIRDIAHVNYIGDTEFRDEAYDYFRRNGIPALPGRPAYKAIGINPEEPSYRLIDGVNRNRQHPDTFEIPSKEEISGLKIKDYVKIGAEFFPDGQNKSSPGERFWLRVTSKTDIEISGTIDNDLVFTEFHGLDSGNILTVEYRHVLSCLKAP